jgi:hypothetical protein
VAARARGEPLPPVPSVPVAGHGAFVTLHRHGDLRGCIGHLVARGPLADLVRDMAVAASQEDPRFPPVGPDELVDLDVEISVLSVPAPATPDAVVPGRHGVIVKRGARQGVLLPQVAVEYGWDRETFLDHTCRKAGLPPHAWREPGTELLVFEAQILRDAGP